MFCPKCGKKEVVDVFCADCLKEERPLVKAFKEFKAELCSRCGKAKYKGTWHDNRKNLQEHFASLVVPAPYAEIESITVTLPEIPLKDGLKIQERCTLHVRGRASPESSFYVEEYSVPCEVQNTNCRRCAKAGTQYFEGTLQVRNEHAEAKDFLKGFIAEQRASVAKMTRQKNGTDYYLSSKAVIERAALELQKRFGGVVKTSVHLFGRDKQRSKDVYRLTALIQLPDFSVGDVVKNNKDVLLVLEMGKRIKFYSLNRGRLIYHEYKAFPWERLAIHETRVDATEPMLSIIHPETFQSTPVKNGKLGEHTAGEKVSVVLDGKRLFIVERA